MDTLSMLKQMRSAQLDHYNSGRQREAQHHIAVKTADWVSYFPYCQVITKV